MRHLRIPATAALLAALFAAPAFAETPAPATQATAPADSPLPKLIPKLPADWELEKHVLKTGNQNEPILEADFSQTTPGSSGYGELTIEDLSALPARVAALQSDFAAFEERRSEVGHDKKLLLDGNPGTESYRAATQSAEIQILVAKRFRVEWTIFNILPEQIPGFIAGLDLKAFEAVP